jgi:hypothetical protein
VIAEQLALLDCPASVVVARDHRPPEQVGPPCSGPADRCSISPMGRHQVVDLSSLHYFPTPPFCAFCGRELAP